MKIHIYIYIYIYIYTRTHIRVYIHIYMIYSGMSDVLSGMMGGALAFGCKVPTSPKHTVIAHERAEVFVCVRAHVCTYMN